MIKIPNNLLLAIILTIVIVSSLLAINNSVITGWVVGTDGTVGEIITEKTIEIEAFADTDLTLEVTGNNASAMLTLDNRTALAEQEIEFYLNELPIGNKTTDSEGYAQLTLNLNETNHNGYFIKATFQGNPSLYLNPSSEEKHIHRRH